MTQSAIASNSKDELSQAERIRRLEQRIAVLEKKEQKAEKNKPQDPVLALPQINARDKYDTAPIYNQDLAMMKMRQKYDSQLRQKGIQPLPYPHIELGGSIIGLATVKQPPDVPPRDGRTQSDINLSGANLNVTSEIMPVLLGAMRISYNPNSAEKFDETTITTRVANSTIFLNTAFLTLGDLNRFPLYLSGGQMFLPFGEYNSSLLFAPLSARLGRFRQRPILLGFQQPGTQNGFNASIFAFEGDAFTNQKNGVINNGGANIGYVLENPHFKLSTGASYIFNIADSGGMQNTGASTIVSDAGEYVDNDYLDFEGGQDSDIPLIAFRGFGARELLVHRVPAYDARAKISLDDLHLTFYGEFVQTTCPFAIENLSFNDEGAQPSAWNAEGSINFMIFDKKSSITVGYGQSEQSLALNLPQSTIGVSFNIKPQKFVSLTLGYQYDTAYPVGDTATGQLLPVSSARFLGTTTKTTTLQVNARF
ncbi:putative Coiled-coil protein [Legionella fallonii LLAP-10]|uniref:Putative Coiled-coil protein n=2 Tax=Legionella fallonii TaxID=96230 RepID=A0A098G9A7_9GAMM|nr:putative Coiled-coil protein [Legionella fallonii LLAP-10]